MVISNNAEFCTMFSEKRGQGNIRIVSTTDGWWLLSNTISPSSLHSRCRPHAADAMPEKHSLRSIADWWQLHLYVRPALRDQWTVSTERHTSTVHQLPATDRRLNTRASQRVVNNDVPRPTLSHRLWWIDRWQGWLVGWDLTAQMPHRDF